MPIPLNTWLFHRQSENVFKVIKIHALHVETMDLDGQKGLANRYLLEQDLARGVYTIDKEGTK
jgi:hypothetical protein